MKAIFNGTVIAKAEREDMIYIEGYWYFPISSLVDAKLQTSNTPYTCPWKGEAQYYNVLVDGKTLTDYAFAYHNPASTAISRVKKDFSRHIAFNTAISVTD